MAEIREKARREKRSVRAVLDEILGLGLAAGEDSGRHRNRKVTLPVHPLGTKPGFQGMSLNQLYDQIETENDAAVR